MSFLRVQFCASLVFLSFGLVACSSDDGPSTDGLADGGASSGDGDGDSGESPGDGDVGGDGDGDTSPGEMVPDVDSSCRTDDDCPAGNNSVCDPVNGCVECLFDWDCAAAHRCEDSACVAKTLCETDEHCVDDDGHPICDEIIGHCVECQVSDDCGEGFRCSSSQCEAVEECTNSRDCSEGKVCDRGPNVCVECVVDGDCGDDSTCVQNACLPRCDSDKQCLGLGLLCDADEGRCVECLTNSDCPEIYHCSEAGSCELDVCEQGQSRCEGSGVVATCNLAGSGFEGSTCSATSSCVEEDMQAQCQEWLCNPAALDCSPDNRAVVTCSADGFAIEDSTPCDPLEACDGATCRTVVCEPGAYSCLGDSLYQCNESGTTNEYSLGCNFNEVCNAETGACEPFVCNPNSPSCDGDIARTCDASGLGFTDVGTDCAELGQACHGGACRPVVCEGSFECNGADLYRCLDNGTRLSLFANCAAASLCREADGTCVAPICNPGAFVCDGETATRCNEEGSGYEADGTDCSATGQACDAGGCLPVICEPNEYYCQGGNPQRCGSKGTTSAQSDTCLSYEFCQEGSSRCRYDVCTAGESLCDGNVATSCASDGSGPTEGGTDCGDERCVNGSCRPVVCTPNARSCEPEPVDPTGEVLRCSADGTALLTEQVCSSSSFCLEENDTAACVPQICSPGTTGCDEEVIATCNSVGSGWVSPGTNCASSNQVCVFGACATEEVVSQGWTSSSRSISDQTVGTRMDVVADRRLTEMQIYVSFTGTQRFVWVVYEKRDESETFDLVHQKVVAEAQSELGWLSSGTLDYELEAGKTYVVGIHTDATISTRYSSSSTYDPEASFAINEQAVYTSSYSTPATAEAFFSSYYRHHFRFSTELP